MSAVPVLITCTRKPRPQFPKPISILDLNIGSAAATVIAPTTAPPLTHWYQYSRFLNDNGRECSLYTDIGLHLESLRVRTWTYVRNTSVVRGQNTIQL